ncbi:MAG: pyruvate kinase [Lachnospiraceae bacterium]|nr:pyruvate kinase [Lachnospiraceae bacterium]
MSEGKTYRKTKIVCTLGPSTDKEETLRAIAEAGMNVARFNFSHGSHEEHLERLNRLRKVREETGLPIATLLDTRGPEIRVGTIAGGEAFLQAGDRFTLTTAEEEGSATRASINYAALPGEVKPGDRILIDDGLIELEVNETTETEITCTVQNGGRIADHKGVNVPGTALSIPFISDADYADILFGIEQDFDFIAASFVRSADDVLELRKTLDWKGGKNIHIISKIENMQGVENLDAIIEASDGIMVARGDMGVEIPLEDVPVIQKEIIKKTVEAGKVVITATQMLDSMMKHPRPTRAEATDVANAIYDGTSAIMLSGETAAGKYPVEAVETMSRIACRTEADINYIHRFRHRTETQMTDETNAISHATCMMAADLQAKAIVAITHSGRTAFMVSKFRPFCPIVGATPDEKSCRQMSLHWGILPVFMHEHAELDRLIMHAIARSKEQGIFENGDTAIVTAGVPLGTSGTTNLIKIEQVG